MNKLKLICFLFTFFSLFISSHRDKIFLGDYMNKKWFLYLVVILLVIGICILFISIFAFEDDKKELTIPEPNEEQVGILYQILPENPMNYQTMYTGSYTRLHNISNDIIQSMIYAYLKNFDNSKLEATTIEEISATGAVLNGEITPIAKIKVAEFNLVYNQIFGPDSELKLEDFRYDYQTLAEVSDDYYYIYETTPLTNSDNEVVFKDIIRYAVTENNKTIEIYDYYLKCDLNDNTCYDDERKTKVNTKIKYSEDLNIEDYLDNTVTYKHTFKYNEGHYYWYSSETV